MDFYFLLFVLHISLLIPYPDGVFAYFINAFEFQKGCGIIHVGYSVEHGVMPLRPSMPPPITRLTSSKSPAVRKAALIWPPPTMARRLTENSVCSISTNRLRSMPPLPQAIHDMFCAVRLSWYCAGQSCEVTTSRFLSAALSS